MSFFPKPNNMKSISENPLVQAFASLQTHFTSVFNPNSFKAHVQSTLSNLQAPLKLPLKNPFEGNIQKSPFFARIPTPQKGPSAGMPAEAIEERLAGVAVYALSNASDEFVLVSGVSTGKSLGFFCFKEEDAEALLEQMRTMDPGMRRGSKVVPVALNKVVQLKVNGVAFRLIPEMSQVENAIKERQRTDISDDDGFRGVPVFQSRSLVLKTENKSYRPVFFRKEDLVNSLQRASQEQRQLNPALRQGDIQVAVLEEIIKGMKDGSKWDDVVFIPPGFDVAAAPAPPTKQ